MILDKLHSRSYSEGDCLIWDRAIGNHGYGIVSWNRKLHLVHRLSFVVHGGTLIDGLLICHRCDVRPCWNPQHLFQGTQKDNIQDAISKERLASGDRSYAKLNPESTVRGLKNGMAYIPFDTITQIREMYATGQYSQYDLSYKFDVSQQHISDLVRMKWRVSE